MKWLIQINILILFLSFTACVNKEIGLNVNTSHLDYLYEEFEIDENEMAFIHIYSNYPDYGYISDDDEGMACVDDVARAAIFYLNHFKYLDDQESIAKNKKLLKFILHMQSESGYFYNFIWDDYSINKDFKTSVAEPNWWSWRALWALTESYPHYSESDKDFASKIKSSIGKIIIAIKNDIPTEIKTKNLNGLEIPSWLPYDYASDQAAVLILGLINYYNLTEDKAIYDYIKLLCDGIIKMQIIDKENKYYGAFLSWQNTWHAYGNSQAYALLKAYPILMEDTILKSVFEELNNFYPTLLKNNYLSSFIASKNEDNIIIEDENKYSQIAYNIRPMIYALIEAFKITNDDKYPKLAGEIAQWFIGNNIAGAVIYNKKNGLVFDGINSNENINRNSGAESTIEALLSILEISQNKIATERFLRE